jgi:ferredoxin
MADRTLTDLTYTRGAIPTRGRCSDCGKIFTTPLDAVANPEKATRDFYAAFAVHQCLAKNLGRSLVILKYKDKVPIVASCSACHRKFLTIATLLHDSRGAEQHLLEKFDLHKCSGDVSLSATQN